MNNDGTSRVEKKDSKIQRSVGLELWKNSVSQESSSFAVVRRKAVCFENIVIFQVEWFLDGSLKFYSKLQLIGQWIVWFLWTGPLRARSGPYAKIFEPLSWNKYFNIIQYYFVKANEKFWNTKKMFCLFIKLISHNHGKRQTLYSKNLIIFLHLHEKSKNETRTVENNDKTEKWVDHLTSTEKYLKENKFE